LLIPGVIVPLEHDHRTDLILTGVVNNAILIIEQALQLQEEGKVTALALAHVAYDQFYVRKHTGVVYAPLAAFSGAGVRVISGSGYCRLLAAFSTIRPHQLWFQL